MTRLIGEGQTHALCSKPIEQILRCSGVSRRSGRGTGERESRGDRVGSECFGRLREGEVGGRKGGWGRGEGGEIDLGVGHGGEARVTCSGGNELR